MERELFITREEQARALQDVTFLGAFLEPASPSDVARRLGMSANLAHHHAQKHAALGLLEVKRERGKVYYQLAARSFKYPRTLLPPEDPENHAAVAPKRLGERFLEAYARSDRIAGRQDPDWIVCSFSPEGAPKLSAPEGDEQRLGPRPLTLRPENYRKLVRQTAALVAQAKREEGKGTLAFLALHGALQEGMRDGHQFSSFVPPAEPA